MQADDATRTSTIRDLNDQFRSAGNSQGSWFITQGVQAEGDAFVRQAIQAVMEFNDFTSDNDPYHEHDFGAFQIQGKRLFWKIDYYDLELTMHSPDAADATLTLRVLTIMLASEW